MFLHPSRITFAGRFQADVSTVNNDVRHYDDRSFDPQFQQLQEKHDYNGWWNPTGSGAFRLVGCAVTSVGHADGSTTADAASEPVLGAGVTGAADRTAAKLVDLDPQWQLASAPWGLAVRLVGPDGAELLRGEYRSNAFRDLWFSRNPNSSGDGAASSTFQSVLEGVVFAEAALEKSQVLRELRSATCGDQLSIRLTTLGYDGKAASPTFTLGTVIGTIGPYLDGEPESYVLGRRFAPASGFTSYGASATFFSGLVHEESSTLFLDLSNALQVSDVVGTQLDIGTLTAGILADESIAENTPVTAETFEAVGTIDYAAPRWLQATGGVVALPLTAAQLDRARALPLALVYDAPFNPGGTGEGGGLGVVAIRETVGGLFVGAEPGVLRLDPGDSAEVTLRATCRGAAISDTTVQLRQLGRVPGQGGSGPDDKTPGIAEIPIPDMGVPEAALELPATAAVDDGAATVVLTAGDPQNSRGYLDGQVYLVDYRLPGQGNSSRQPFDYVVVHVRDAYEPPEAPTWETDVKPVLTQFANLYPIMSRGFIDLSDEAAVRENRDLLILSFTRPMTDPNHMPVTRDLSAAKRRMLVAWLESLNEPVTSEDGAGRRPVPGHRPGGPPLAEPAPDHDVAVDSKSRFAHTFLRPERSSRSDR
ncbi:hypothetical protein FHX52_2659 [Humibacillus xanthopallidus]|uniref:Uncharacterized protein n=1 Tax=Humibacillus xanthopallidus TaxID=412689 RepID=A0A543PPE8_9MICO|nr:hypothetical protein FHX52_2659 [Humibacillus xanthopallidus]